MKRGHGSLHSLALSIALILTAAPAVSSEAVPGTTFAARLQEIRERTALVTDHALTLLGIRYRMGGNTPESGMDCSGLVRYVFQQAWGKDLPRTSVEQSRAGEKISLKELLPGDLVFFNTRRKQFSHVGIYLGENRFIHAPSSGGSIRIERTDVAYWKKRFNGARRIDSGPLGHGTSHLLSEVASLPVSP